MRAPGRIAAAVILVLFFGCAAPQVGKETPAPQVMESRTPTTLAVLPFENNSITDPARYEPLGRGLAAMLITDLKNAGTSLRLIERS
ncbi:MAG: hypothetical protein Q8P24_08535, partial [Desulfobacterales bacterium]|nr:hypothetical protein [Desulfobacterales bacterium]